MEISHVLATIVIILALKLLYELCKPKKWKRIRFSIKSPLLSTSIELDADNK